MSYTALYRKFRPQSFDEVRGQDHIVTTLRNQILADRIGHAYLFTGTRGTGKTTVAKIFARAVNCESPRNGSPCGECAVCRAMASGAALNVVEMDAASHRSIEDVRQIIDEVDYSPTIGKRRVYIIDEVHMFTKEAFNALLKTLEEPPEHAMFILATTDLQKIPVTILSRCQRYDFHRISLEEICARLKVVSEAEGIDVTDDAVSYIARASDGAMRDGLSILDQCAAFHYGEQLTLDKVLDVLGAVEVDVYGALFDALTSGDVTASLDRVAEAVGNGRDLVQYTDDFIWYLRNLMLIKAAGAALPLMDLSTDNRAALTAKAEQTDLDLLLRYIRIFSELSAELRRSVQKRVLMEVTIIRLLRPQTESKTGELAARVSALENRSDADEQALRGAMEKWKKGAAVMPARDGSGEDAADARSAEREKKARALAQALPGEVMQALERRNEIIRRVKSDFFRSYLSRKAFGVDPDGCIVVSGEETEDYAARSNGRLESELKEAIESLIGKEVRIRFDAPDAKGGQTYSAEEILQSRIPMDMEIEEEEGQKGEDY
ncbi:MAG: DNA polymerase III subunit gamma/tau [Lachnospiraceae bacterium]|nr:DNA polymerase III subunit gamma/tau [Lachnospiraceae bacterium]